MDNFKECRMDSIYLFHVWHDGRLVNQEWLSGRDLRVRTARAESHGCRVAIDVLNDEMRMERFYTTADCV